MSDSTTHITFVDGGRGTAMVETGRHGGRVLVLRRGYPVAAEVVAGIKVEHITRALLGAFGLDSRSVAALAGPSHCALCEG